MRRLLFYLLLLTVIASCGTSTNSKQPPSDDSIHHQNIVSDSLPQPTGYVNDYENIFTSNEKHILDSLIRDFEQRTTIQATVITVDTSMTTPQAFEQYTLRVARHWGVGQQGSDNGILIGISQGYRQMRIQNGVGIEKILTDQETQRIIDTAFIPAFRGGNYFRGTYNGLRTLIAVLQKRYTLEAVSSGACMATIFLNLKDRHLQAEFFRKLDSVRKIQYPGNDQDIYNLVDISPALLGRFLKDIDVDSLRMNGVYEASYFFNIAPKEYTDSRKCLDIITIRFFSEDCSFRMIVDNVYPVKDMGCAGGAQVIYAFKIVGNSIGDFGRQTAG